MRIALLLAGLSLAGCASHQSREEIAAQYPHWTDGAVERQYQRQLADDDVPSLAGSVACVVFFPCAITLGIITATGLGEIEGSDFQ
ncbi:MAG: hypothetical protein AAF526_08620 [Pseudomonadota bacterium]